MDSSARSSTANRRWSLVYESEYYVHPGKGKRSPVIGSISRSWR